MLRRRKSVTIDGTDRDEGPDAIFDIDGGEFETLLGEFEATACVAKAENCDDKGAYSNKKSTEA